MIMSVVKRNWRQGLNIKDVADIAIDWCIKAREKNIIANRPPQIIYSYVVKSSPGLGFLTPISSAFKYSTKDTPENDRLREDLLRLLSIAIKTHFYLYEMESISHEPYYFVFPCLEDAKRLEVGLVYTLEKSNVNIMVSTKDLEKLYSKEVFNNNLLTFHSVLDDDSFHWYSLKNWNKQKTLNNKSPWFNRDEVKALKKIKDIQELERLAYIVSVPYEEKELLKSLNIEWSSQLKVWFLPIGYDVDGFNLYRDMLNKNVARGVQGK